MVQNLTTKSIVLFSLSLMMAGIFPSNAEAQLFRRFGENIRRNREERRAARNNNGDNASNNAPNSNNNNSSPGLSIPEGAVHSDETMNAKEAYLNAFNINDSSLTFKRLGGGTTPTNWMVKDANGRPVASLKCTALNTVAEGAVATYKLGRTLGFNIYPVAVYKSVSSIVENGQTRDLRNTTCVLKEWAQNWAQTYYTYDMVNSGSTGSAEKDRILSAVKNCRAYTNQTVTLATSTRYSHPEGRENASDRFYGESDLDIAAKDFSNMMVIDALIGQGDRFPGGNTQVRATDYRNTPAVQQRDGSYFLAGIRLFSLDNEASFKSLSSSTYGITMLENNVRRFDGNIVSRLRSLAANNYAGLQQLSFLNFSTRDGRSNGFAVVKTGIAKVLETADRNDSCEF